MRPTSFLTTFLVDAIELQFSSEIDLVLGCIESATHSHSALMDP